MDLKPIPELCAFNVRELSDMLASGKCTSVELTKAYMSSIALNNERLNAYIEVYAEDALSEAALSDERRKAGCPLSKLDGIPVAVKDNIVMRGRICSCGSRMLSNFVSPYDAEVVTRLRAAGMPILGRLNMDEFAMGGSTEHSVYGATRNPWDLSRVPGGSSGGSAAAVAASMAPLALGSDTGGSIRQPASFCGITGVKPAYGAVSRYGLVAFASSFDQIGVLAKAPRDAALLLDIICGADSRDMTSDSSLSTGFFDAVSTVFTGEKPLKGFKIGIINQFTHSGADDEVFSSISAAAEQWAQLGAELTEVSIPSLRFALPAYYVMSSAEASSNLARYDGVRYGYRAEAYKDLDELYRASRSEGFGNEVKRRIMLGTFALSSGYRESCYLKAQKARELITDELSKALEDFGALLSPTAPAPAFKLGEYAHDPTSMYLGDLYTVPANLAGLPSISIPCGLSAEGLPIGMSLMGSRNSLPTLLAASACFCEVFNPLRGKCPCERTEGGASK